MPRPNRTRAIVDRRRATEARARRKDVDAVHTPRAAGSAQSADIPRRGPNVVLVGGRHPSDPRNRTYADLDAEPPSRSPASGCGP